MAILIFIVILVGLILVHELGHLVAAKWFGIRVDQFNIGFPPRLFKIQKGETLYSFNLLLLGGYVQIYGENPEEGAAGDPRALSSRSRWTQAAVVVAGVAVNALVAWLLLSAGYMAGLPAAVDHQGVGVVTNARPMVVGILPGSPAEKAGLMGGDVIETIQTGTTKLDTRTQSTDRQAEVVRAFIGQHAEESLVFTVVRQKQEKTFLAKAEDGLVEGRKAVGIELADVGILQLPPHLALWQGALLAKNIFVQTAAGLGNFAASLVRGGANFNQVSGPIGIVTMGGVAVQEGFAAAIVLVASISMALALFNLIPIPGLDGGRLLILAIEGVLRRRVPQKLVIGLTLAGMALLILLMVVVSYNDIAKLVG
ncbi:MAG: site-2 protease family protein [Patescibacteria group bacterium]